MTINEKKLAAISGLPGADRYSHFIKAAADKRSVWGLFNEGWALAVDDDGVLVLPVWPDEAYAKQCALREWSEYTPREVELDVLLRQVIPSLAENGQRIGVFPTPSQQGVVPVLSRLHDDLTNELGRIE